MTDLVHHEADEYSRQGGSVERIMHLKCIIVQSDKKLNPNCAGLKAFHVNKTRFLPFKG